MHLFITFVNKGTGLVMKVLTLASTEQFPSCIQLKFTWRPVNKHEAEDTGNGSYHAHQFMKHVNVTHHCQCRQFACLYPKLVIIWVAFGRHVSDLNNDFKKNKSFYDDDNVAELGLLGLCSFLFLHPYKDKTIQTKKNRKVNSALLCRLPGCCAE